MKYNGYDVYDILYRNDSGVKNLLENDLLFSITGLIALQDTENRIWLFYKKAGLLIPIRQEYLDRTYGKRDTLPKITNMRIGKDECECSLPDEDCARELFAGLSQLDECNEWGVEKRLWKLSSIVSAIYDAPAKMLRVQQHADRVTLLRCAYISDRRTKRRNFTNFSNWKYITAHELTSEGKIALVLPKPAQADAAGAKASVSGTMPSGSPASGAAPSSKPAPGVAPSPSSASGAAPSSSSASGAPSSSPAPGAAPSPSSASGAAPSGTAASGAGTVMPTAAPSGTAAPAGAQQGAASSSAAQPEVSTTAPETVQTDKDLLPADMVSLGNTASGDIPAAGETIPNAASAGPSASGTVTQGKSAAASGSAATDTPSSEAAASAAMPAKPASVSAASPGFGTSNAASKAALSEGEKQKEKKVMGIKDLVDCDKRRCRLESYEENMLYDIKRGHWDLFDGAEAAENPEAGKLVPRDPRKDIRTGVVGIDFGTKSTVVVRQDDTNAIMPIRIGAAVLSAGLTESDYENPTIIECTNLDEFIRKYNEKPGRPETSCEDFFVSYDAYNNYRSCPPNEFYAYYADLKQWSNHQKENVLVLDKQRQEYRFGVSGSQSEKVINPIELYAYYIGLYINNMRNGIYMKYLMSFPVGYSKETRQLILTSFERGIRKSLPSCILKDEECMKEFSVKLGISEPAAYAVTALDMSELEPKDENDRYRYGIFDFGGGTADFGFGIWRGASEEEYDVEGYDYVLECFGADSDVTLGGENILELLGYAVFKKNREMARRKRITCSLPYGEQAFLGSEALIANSQIAQRNMSILKEELRPLWHQEKDWEKKYRHEPEEVQIGEDGPAYEEYIDLSMYDIDGNRQADCRFLVDTEELISLIKARIQKGIDAFFKCMSKAFQKEDELMGPGGPMYIFLAGNSSKSVFVRELFEKAIQGYSGGDPSGFLLMEPLNAENNRGLEYVPNAKTSVAYGLIKSREGSSIKVEKNLETDAEEQTRFKYYLGRERRRHFDCKLSPVETEYGSWIRFQGAAKQTVRIYYTTDPTADVKDAPPVIDNIPYREIMIEPQNGAFIFIRTCEPTVIEYAVSFSEERIGEGDEIYRMDFGM